MKISFMFLGCLLDRDLGLRILVDSTGITFKDNEKALEKAEQRLIKYKKVEACLLLLNKGFDLPHDLQNKSNNSLCAALKV